MKNNSHQDLVSNQRNVYNVIYETNYRTWRKSYMDLTKLTAYEIIEHRPLPDLKSEGALLRHKKSGARVLLISDQGSVCGTGKRIFEHLFECDDLSGQDSISGCKL